MLPSMVDINIKRLVLCKLLSVIFADYIILTAKANYPIAVSVALFPLSHKKYLHSRNPKSPEAPQATSK